MKDRTKGLIANWLSIFGLANVLIGLVAANAGSGAIAAWGTEVVLSGLFWHLIAFQITRRMERIPLRTKQTVSVEYRQLQASGARAASVFVHLLLVIAVLVIGTAIALKFEALELTLTRVTAGRFVAGIAGALMFGAVAAHFLSLRSSTNFVYDWTDGWRLGLSWIGYLMFAALAYIADGTNLAVGSTIILEAGDHELLLMGAAGVVSYLTVAGRKLPGLYAIMQDANLPVSPDAGNRNKAVIIPTLLAFVLMFVMILLLLGYGVGVSTLVSGLKSNPLVLVGIVGMILAAFAALGVAYALVNKKEDIRRVDDLDEKEDKEDNGILIGSAVFAAMIVGVAVASKQGILSIIPAASWFDAVVIAILVGIGPFGFVAAKRYKTRRLMEDRFPDFLRDIASSHKGGLTLPASVAVAARGDYGLLTGEIRKMADQLTWHVPFQTTLIQLAERVRTPLVKRAVTLILEAGRSGGNTHEVLMAAARDARELKMLEQDRSLNMSLYAVVIYVTFFVFLFVAGILYSQFVPEILLATEKASNLGGGGGFGGISFTQGGPGIDDYRTFYFTAAVVQGLGSGVLAGLMSTGKAALGLKHSFYMVLIAWISFVFVL